MMEPKAGELQIDWEFRFGATAWCGPYPSCEEACQAAADNIELTPEESTLVVVAALAGSEYDTHAAQCLRILKSERGWYIRMYRGNSPTRAVWKG